MKLKIQTILIIYGGLAFSLALYSKRPEINDNGIALINSIYGHPDYESQPQEDSVLEGVHSALQYNVEKIQLPGIHHATTSK